MSDDPNGGLSDAEAGKAAAALRAVELVTPGMRVGLGTGSTASWFVRALAARNRAEDLDLICVATSTRTAELAAALGLTVVELDDAGTLDLTVDGADEFDPGFRLIKGGGGAHLREMIVASASAGMVVITDPSKEVAALGAFPLPVEIARFGNATTVRLMGDVLADADVDRREVQLRMKDGAPFVTDEGNLTVDLHLGRIGDAEALAPALRAVPGVIETGLFLGICDTVVIGHVDGRAEVRRAGGVTETSRMDLNGAAALPAA